MTEWQRFGDFATFKYGKMPNKKKISHSGFYPVYSGYRYVGYYDEYNTEANQLIVVARGCGTGDAKLTRERCYLTNLSISASIDENTALPEYIFYYFLLRNLRYLDSGSAQSQITISDLQKVLIPLPLLDEQRKICSYLRMLDAKISENKRINKNLLEQASLLFKSWFVNFDPFDEPLISTPAGIVAPASLKMLQISDIPHTLETGRRPKGGAVSKGIPSIGAENVKALGSVNFSSAKYIPEEFAAKMKTGAVKGYELMLYKDGGKPGTFTPHFSMFGEGFPYEIFFINEHVFKLDFYNHGYNEFAYFYMQTDYPYHWLANNGGKAAIPGINQQDVNSIWIFTPDNPKVKEFCDWVQPLFTTILTNCSQNMKLAKMRGSLLPDLMSGKIDVSDIDI